MTTCLICDAEYEEGDEWLCPRCQDFDIDVVWVCPQCGEDMPNEQTCTNCGDVDELDVWDDDDKPRCPTCESVLDAKEENHPAPYWCPSCRAYWAFGGSEESL